MITIVLNQMLLMFLLMFIGFILKKINLLDDVGTTQISNILFNVCTPAIMIKTFNRPFESQVLKEFMVTFGLSIIILVISYIIGYLIYGSSNPIEWFSIIFSNVGFMGIPLVESFIGEEAVFYVSVFMIASNLFIWSIGIFIITNDRQYMSLKKVLKTPAFIGLYLGIIVLLVPFELPLFINQCIEYLSNLNTPLAMIVLGSYIASIPIEKFISKRVVTVSFLRLILVPIIIIPVLSFFKNIPVEMRQALVICSSAPVGVIAALFAKQFDIRADYSTAIVGLSTILSIITLPIVFLLM